MERKIIGYKLIKPEYEQAAIKITGFITGGTISFTQFMMSCTGPNYIASLRNAGVLNLWFEPVYKDEFKVGDWVVLLDSGSSVSCSIDGKRREGLKINNASQITGITSNFGCATPSDPRYYGDNWNARKKYLRKATKEEIEKAQIPNITIKGYKAEFIGNNVKFGCKAYSKESIEQIVDLYEMGIIESEYDEEIFKIHRHLNK